MLFNIHAGHNPDGKVACGACGIVKESTEAEPERFICQMACWSSGGLKLSHR